MTLGSSPRTGSLRVARTARRIRRFIVRELLDETFRGDDPLAAGALDSLAVEQLVEYIETTFGVHFRDDELVAETFSSIPALAALVADKQRDSGPG